MQESKLDNNVKIFFDTLGCAKNTCDTNKMIELLRSAGYQIIDNAKDSDLIILNTCAFIEAATQESIDTFFEYKNYFKDKPILVVGCMPSRYGEDLKNSLNEADGFLPCDKEDKIVEVVEAMNLSPKSLQAKEFSDPSVYSYVKISEGCNRCCSYCMIPKIRGKYKSSPYDEIRDEVAQAKDKGAQEVILVAQDCGVWGLDIGSNLCELLDKLSSEFSDIVFRILYIQPDAVNEKLLNLIASRENISKYLDIPLQHCSESLLKNMNRKGNAEQFLDKLSMIRKAIPDCTLRTTFIVGFPGETESDFEELCDFVQKANFDYAGCFEYSNEEGSASSKLSGQVADEIKYSRTNVLREILDTISINKLNEKIGNTYQIIIEGFDEGRYFGRASFQAPDVDGVVFISEFCDTEKISIGQFVNVKIQDIEGYDLVGVIYNG